MALSSFDLHGGLNSWIGRKGHCKTAFGKADNSCGITKHDFEKLLQPQQTPVDADGKRITSRRGGVQLPPPPPLPL